MIKIGEKIRSVRQLRGMSQAEVAEKLKISIPAFSKMETGITDLNLSRLNQIATIFDITTIKLLTWEEDTPPVEGSALTKAIQTLSEREAEIGILQAKLILLYDTLLELNKKQSAILDNYKTYMTKYDELIIKEILEWKELATSLKQIRQIQFGENSLELARIVKDSEQLILNRINNSISMLSFQGLQEFMSFIAQSPSDCTDLVVCLAKA